ncbi:MAG: type II secretion system protein [Candidatus Gastranaerophilales bacterium]|nr:type II secretion system protein [Candidatus Gastranaerophilales bacterium]
MRVIQKRGFTLAEVLITLMIIGVIASITIPALVNDIQDAQYKASFKKVYGTASQVWRLVVAENPSTYVGSSGWSPCGSATDGRGDAFKAKFNVVKSCANQDGCWPLNYEYNYILGYAYGETYSPKRFSWITSDGICWASPWHASDDAHILVDTNCEKGPNLIGKDIFSFLLGADGIVYFAIDDTSANGRPVSSGKVGPYLASPATINGRSVDFKSWLTN